MTEILAVFSAVVSVVALVLAAKSASASERSARTAEESVGIARRATDAAVRSAEAAEQSNLLTKEGLDLQRAAAEADEKERQRQQRTTLVVEGWSGEGGLVVTNQGPGAATEIMIILTSPARHARFAGLAAGVQRRFPIRETNGWPDDFDPDPPPGRGNNPDVAWVNWRNSDGTYDRTGWVQAPAV